MSALSFLKICDILVFHEVLIWNINELIYLEIQISAEILSIFKI